MNLKSCKINISGVFISPTTLFLSLSSCVFFITVGGQLIKLKTKENFDYTIESAGQVPLFSGLHLPTNLCWKNLLKPFLLSTLVLRIKGKRGEETVKYADRKHLAGAVRTGQMC